MSELRYTRNIACRNHCTASCTARKHSSLQGSLLYEKGKPAKDRATDYAWTPRTYGKPTPTLLTWRRGGEATPARRCYISGYHTLKFGRNSKCKMHGDPPTPFSSVQSRKARAEMHSLNFSRPHPMACGTMQHKIESLKLLQNWKHKQPAKLHAL
jgi:hypothetical protein